MKALREPDAKIIACESAVVCFYALPLNMQVRQWFSAGDSSMANMAHGAHLTGW